MPTRLQCRGLPIASRMGDATFSMLYCTVWYDGLLLFCMDFSYSRPFKTTLLQPPVRPNSIHSSLNSQASRSQNYLFGMLWCCTSLVEQASFLRVPYHHHLARLHLYRLWSCIGRIIDIKLHYKFYKSWRFLSPSWPFLKIFPSTAIYPLCMLISWNLTTRCLAVMMVTVLVSWQITVSRARPPSCLQAAL